MPLSLRKATLGAGMEPVYPSPVLWDPQMKEARKNAKPERGHRSASSPHSGVRTENSQLILSKPHRAEMGRPMDAGYVLQPSSSACNQAFSFSSLAGATQLEEDLRGGAMGKCVLLGGQRTGYSLRQGINWPHVSLGPQV